MQVLTIVRTLEQVAQLPFAAAEGVSNVWDQSHAIHRACVLATLRTYLGQVAVRHVLVERCDLGRVLGGRCIEVDEQRCHNAAEEGPDAHAPEQADRCQPAVHRCCRVLLPVACPQGSNML